MTTNTLPWDEDGSVTKIMAKKYAAFVGDKGKVGGWIYSKNGLPIAQGWFDYQMKFRRRIWEFHNTQS